MENHTKSTKNTKLKFLRFLPKATSMTFQNLPFSPTKAHTSKLMLPGLIIPAEARLRHKKTLAREPTSPKISCVFNGGDKPAGRKSDAGLSERAPSLSQMRRFASGRDSIANFDWTAQISPVDGDEEEGPTTVSGPIVVNGVVLEPKKEINLWKRRTMARPKPLKI